MLRARHMSYARQGICNIGGVTSASLSASFAAVWGGVNCAKGERLLLQNSLVLYSHAKKSYA